MLFGWNTTQSQRERFVSCTPPFFHPLHHCSQVSHGFPWFPMVSWFRILPRDGLGWNWRGKGWHCIGGVHTYIHTYNRLCRQTLGTCMVHVYRTRVRTREPLPQSGGSVGSALEIGNGSALGLGMGVALELGVAELRPPFGTQLPVRRWGDGAVVRRDPLAISIWSKTEDWTRLRVRGAWLVLSFFDLSLFIC